MSPEGLRAELDESDLADDPYAQFAAWLTDAAAAGLPEPTAMVIATADSSGRPSARHVLLKEYDERGFAFYTNLGSRKAQQLAVNPHASAVFPWSAIRRQVIVCGVVEQVTRAEAAAYFATRPRGAQIGAWASRQSSVIASRQLLDQRVAEVEQRFPDVVPLPEFWGGFRVVPATIEFWQGRLNRLHDRLQYRRSDGRWVIERLSP
ncbi:MAG: pyridoxamine 5'-phosphate oxidase [Actinomycetes bacterium]